VETLYTTIIGFIGGIVGAIGSDFVRTPFRLFFTQRTEIRHEMLRLANVPAPDPKWTHPTYSQGDLDRLLAPSREAQRTLRTLGTRMRAFGETERLATRCVQVLGFEPLEAADGLIGLSNTFSEYGSERAAHRARINKALRFPD
jgi:hypothetical protein